ncbi:MAG: hypothetical protein EOP52_11050 [Sphingobacteriales bacterium]|nr:MAG: hypothetical protein EOP52_11050 [Sphingobacteriales bacterium]
MKTVFSGILILTLVLLAAPGFAQGCSVCTKTASDLGEGSARGLNGGIIYLASVPLIALASIGLIWWRRNRSVG